MAKYIKVRIRTKTSANMAYSFSSFLKSWRCYRKDIKNMKTCYIYTSFIAYLKPLKTLRTVQ